MSLLATDVSKFWYGKFRIKTELKEYKSRQLSCNKTSFDSQSTIEIGDYNQEVEDFDKEDTSSSSQLAQFSEEILSLQSRILQLEGELEKRNEMIGQMKETADITDRKYDESERRVQLLNVTLLEKEKSEESFKNETNSQVCEALQYIKLIEQEFRLDCLGIEEDAELEIVT